ncbi:DNA polymerase III subunit chi [Ottowia thiooxydans]|uniref:DNA polymerase-3 subunit chi n=1 Tax=Ottowia thiooxydans TaxID=219182 RepID=A0ABV2QGF5_9BURK
MAVQMTGVEFHFNVPDKLGYACRLLRKAYSAGAKVGVLGDKETLLALNAALWTFSALDFIPHCAASAKPSMLAATPIVLALDASRLPHTQVLLHLGQEVPEGFERFERLLELVSQDETDRANARQRWRHYASRGYAIEQHGLGRG